MVCVGVYGYLRPACMTVFLYKILTAVKCCYGLWFECEISPTGSHLRRSLRAWGRGRGPLPVDALTPWDGCTVVRSLLSCLHASQACCHTSLWGVIFFWNCRSAWVISPLNCFCRGILSQQRKVTKTNLSISHLENAELSPTNICYQTKHHALPWYFVTV